MDLMETSVFPPDDWRTNEISMFNLKINRKTFLRENGELVRTTFDNILCLATSLPQDNPLVFPAYGAYVLFPRLILRSLPPGCKGNTLQRQLRDNALCSATVRLRSCSVAHD